MTVSVGVVCRIPQQEHTSDWWVGRADQALYISKRSGRNRVAWCQTQEIGGEDRN